MLNAITTLSAAGAEAIPPGVMATGNTLAISSRTVFVDVAFVRAARGISADKVRELVDAGKLLWVFNLARTNERSRPRHLRFWSPEILNAQAVADLRLENVIEKILPAARHRFNGAEIGRWLMISRSKVQQLGFELTGVLENRRLLHIPRQPLADYLASRWIGGAKA